MANAYTHGRNNKGGKFARDLLEILAVRRSLEKAARRGIDFSSFSFAFNDALNGAAAIAK
jgi:hypothetical protein